MKEKLENLKALAQRHGAKVGAGLSALGASVAAHADDLTTSAQVGITAAQTQGTTVGGYVVAAVAALCVVGVIIGIVKKM